MIKRIKVNKRIHICIITVLLLVLVTPIKCEAKGEKTQSDYEANVEDIIKDFSSLIPEGAEGADSLDGASEQISVKRIIENTLTALNGERGQLGLFLLMLLGVGVIGAVSSQIRGEVSEVASRACLGISSVLIFDRLSSIILGAVRSLGEINDFFGAVIPISLAVNSVGVSPTSAGTQAAGMGLTLGLYSFISSKLIGGVAIAVFICACAASFDPVLQRLSRGIRNVFLSCLGILTSLVGATFSLQSVIASSADSAVVRGAKYAVSSTVPIVGSSVSGALGLALGGASYARGVVGAGAIAVIVSLVLSPLVILLAYRFCLNIGAFFFGICSIDGYEGVLSNFLGALDCVIAVYAMTALIYIVELVAFLKGGVSIAQ